MGRQGNFRNQKVTAPLKHVHSRAELDVIRDFRNQKVTAPLKQKIVGMYTVSLTYFRNQKVTAPLKLISRERRPDRPLSFP